jgi:penicillin-binding protein activator
MKHATLRTTLCLALAGTALLGSGCAMFRSSVKSVDPGTAKPMDANYDFLDLKWLGDTVAVDILASDLIRKAPQKPILVVMGIQNRTSRHIDTKAITDTMRTQLINSGKTLFVNESQRDTLLKEQGYQLANCTPETRTAIGKQLGAHYMLTGSLVEIRKETPRQVRVSKEEQVYYQLTMEITDLQSGLIAWTAQKERLRSAGKPLIGW